MLTRRLLLLLLITGLFSGGAFAGAVASGTWYEFSFADTGSFATGCYPLDPSGGFCPIDPPFDVVLTDPPAWTFSAGPEGALFTITDVAVAGDQFLVYDNGSPILLTDSVPANFYVCQNGGPAYIDPEICLFDPNLSHGQILLSPGSHAITIQAVNSPYLGGVADFQWAELPEPGTLLLVGGGLLGMLRFRDWRRG